MILFIILAGLCVFSFLLALVVVLCEKCFPPKPPPPVLLSTTAQQLEAGHEPEGDDLSDTDDDERPPYTLDERLDLPRPVVHDGDPPTSSSSTSTNAQPSQTVSSAPQHPSPHLCSANGIHARIQILQIPSTKEIQSSLRYDLKKQKQSIST